MSENISEQSEGITTSITGLTCKPLAILSETISTQEMNMARGGGDDEDDDPDPIDWNPVSIFKAIVSAVLGPPDDKYPDGDLGTNGPQVPVVAQPPEPVDPFAVLLDNPDVDDPDDPYVRDSDPFKRIAEADSLREAELDLSEGGEEDEGNCEYCDDENCEGCGNNDNEGDEGSGLPDEENSTEGNNG